jgi:uncharacterized membrane protein
MSQTKNFLAQLFDFSFTDFITPKLVGIVYGIGIGVVGVYSLITIVTGFYEAFWLGLLGLVVAPFIFLGMIIILRFYLEFLVVMFRVAQNTSRIAENTKDLRNF